jgi:hypothetical protein
MLIDFNEQFAKHELSIRVSCDSLSNVIDSSFERAKHNLPRISTLRGMQIDLNEQFKKHESSIRASSDSFSNIIDSISLCLFRSPAKQDLPMISTLREMQIDFNEQCKKQESSIRVSRDSCSNMIDLRFKPVKHDLPMISTLRGIQIDCNEQFEKQNSSICVSRDSSSNSIDSIVEREKHDFLRISTLRGMQIDFNEQLEKHDTSIPDSCDSLSNIINSSWLHDSKHDLPRNLMPFRIATRPDSPKYRIMRMS